VDSERLTYMGYQLAAILTVPLQIIAGVIMMYHFIGISFASGFGAMIFLISCTFFVNKRSIKYNE
jgi:O-antigen/teichoic acid export membrane protein